MTGPVCGNVTTFRPGGQWVFIPCDAYDALIRNKFGLPDPEARPPPEETRIRARDHQAHPPVDVVLDAVAVRQRSVGRVAVLEEDVPARAVAAVDAGAVDRE